MKIIAYPLYAHAPSLQPAAAAAGAGVLEGCTRVTVDEAAYANLDLTSAQGQGWQWL